MLEQMPLTPNGKVDRKALPDPGSAGGSDRKGASYLPPRTPLEAQLAEVWADVLQKERIGVTDSFFALGGHSLSAMLMVSRVRNTMGLELPLRSLFETPTIEGLALAITRAQQKTGQEQVPPPITALARENDDEETPLDVNDLSGEEIDLLLSNYAKESGPNE
jgi:acyl carrier protein